MIQEPYPTDIVIVAGATAILPTLGKVITWLLVELRATRQHGW